MKVESSAVMLMRASKEARLAVVNQGYIDILGEAEQQSNSQKMSSSSCMKRSGRVIPRSGAAARLISWADDYM